MRIYTLIIANFLAIGALLFSFFGQTSLALQNPVSGETSVTATVIDRLAPTTPILISPDDGEKLKTGDLVFVWQESTDNWLMDHYTLTLNDEILFDTIPLTATTSAEYTLEYDSLTGYYTLTLEDALSDGDYDWSITAWDYHGNSTSSVTWSFSVDTQAPEFTITTIENQTVEITTGDADSVPNDPIVLEENEPTLSGTGERDSTVVLTITFADGSTDTVTFEIDSDGEWTITLDSLPRDETLLLSFLITDPTGNISILEDIPLILYSPVVIIPVPEVPFFPSAGEPAPVIEVPVLPPIEYVPPVIRKAPAQVGHFVRNLSVSISEHYRSWLDLLLSFILVFMILALPFIKLSLLSQWYRPYLSPQLLKEFLWVIGWWPKQNPHGTVVSRGNQGPVQFSLVLISGKNSRDQVVFQTMISNDAGIFPYSSLEDGSYRISTNHPDYFFPTLVKKPSHLDDFTYYTGATLTVKNGILPPLLIIPVEPLEKKHHTWSYQARKAILLAPSLSIPLAFLSLCVCLAFPSFINICATTIYTFLLIKKKVIYMKNTCEVRVVDQTRQGVPATILGFKKENNTQISILTQTRQDGSAKIALPPGLYQVWCINFQHSLLEGDNKTSTTFKHDVSKNYLPLIVK